MPKVDKSLMDKAIEDEKDGVIMYQKLIDAEPDEANKEILRSIQADERRHKKLLEEMLVGRKNKKVYT